LNFYLVLMKDSARSALIEKLLNIDKNTYDSLLDTERSSKEYFRNYPRNGDISFSAIRPLLFRYFGVSSKDIENFLLVEKTKQLFPNYISLQLTKDNSGDILQTLKDCKLNLNLLSTLINYNKSSTAGNTKNVIIEKNNFEITEDNNIPTNTFGSRTNANLEPKTEVVNQTVNIYDLASFIKGLLTTNSNQQIFLDVNEALAKIQDNTNPVPFIAAKEFSQTPEQVKLSTTILGIKIDNLIKKHFRTYKDILYGRPCYSEILTFQIDKSRKGGPIIQSYFFENDKSDLLNFIDTQVKPDTEYVYNLKYHIAVIGNKYKYKELAKNNNVYKLTVSNIPQVTIFTVEANPVLLDALSVFPSPKTPPATPIVTPIIVKNKNKIKFVFGKNSDSYKEKYELIQDSDLNKLNQLWDSQEVPTSLRNIDTPILFKSSVNKGADPHILDEDYKPEKYEIFKTTVPPTQYLDFKNKLYKTTHSTSFIDTDILANTKYYYTFRAVNQDNFASNPTNVFEVELIQNSGVSYQVVKPYEFSEVAVSESYKEFSRYLYISPAYLQTLMKLNSPDQINTASANVSLGPQANSIWNRKFKIRVTSKYTGKKIDINFIMKYGPKDTSGS